MTTRLQVGLHLESMAARAFYPMKVNTLVGEFPEVIWGIHTIKYFLLETENVKELIINGQWYIVE